MKFRIDLFEHSPMIELGQNVVPVSITEDHFKFMTQPIAAHSIDYRPCGEDQAECAGFDFKVESLSKTRRAKNARR